MRIYPGFLGILAILAVIVGLSLLPGNAPDQPQYPTVATSQP